MKKIFTFLFALLATTCLLAQDFKFGDLCYNITSSTTVEVTHGYYPGGYSNLETATIPETVTYNGTTYSVTSIGNDAFAYCSSLTHISIPSSVMSIGDGAFCNCSSLPSITLPNSIINIGSGAFSGCSSLISPVYNADCFAYMPTSFEGAYMIPDGIKQIAGSAFYDCSSLTSITIPNSVMNIGDRIFLSCSSLTSILVEEGNTTYDSRDNCNAVIATATNTLIAGCPTTTIPSSVTSIGDYAFEACSSLNSVTISNNVTSIGYAAFRSCTSITSVTIPNSVTHIGGYAFYNCSSLNSVTIGNSVTSIEEMTFSQCQFLNSITCLAKTPPVLDRNAISKNTIIYIPDNTKEAYEVAWGRDYVYIYSENSLTLHVEVPGTLVDLILDAGARPVSVAKLTLTGTLNEDDFACIRDTMTSLVDIDLSGITNTTGVYLTGKEDLLKVLLPEYLTSIGKDAFCDCSLLKSIIIPNSVTSIEYGAFSSCRSLTGIAISNSVTSIGDWAFSTCSSLTDITIPNSVTSIGDWAFASCYSLIDITIPNSVTTIGEHAFMYCSHLSYVTIGNSVTNIGIGAFVGCEWLSSITCLGTTPPEASYLEVNTSECTLIVPHSAYNEYLRHNYWGQFLNIVPSYDIVSATPEIYTNFANPAQKILRDGQVYILQNGKTYTITGQEI